MDRRRFLQSGAAALAAWPLCASGADSAAQNEAATKNPLPRWRGFNLHPFFGGWNNGKPVERDFQLIAELGRSD